MGSLFAATHGFAAGFAACRFVRTDRQVDQVQISSRGLICAA